MEKLDIHQDCTWEKHNPEKDIINPLQRLTEAFCGNSKDLSVDKLDAFSYGIIVGWSEDCREQLKKQHKWSDEVFDNIQEWHQKYILAWNLLNNSNFVKKITKQGEKFYTTDNSKIKVGDEILYKIGNHKDYPTMFGYCLGFDDEGFIMIHDDMSIHKSMCEKLIEIDFVESKVCD